MCLIVNFIFMMFRNFLVNIIVLIEVSKSQSKAIIFINYFNQFNDYFIVDVKSFLFLVHFSIKLFNAHNP